MLQNFCSIFQLTPEEISLIGFCRDAYAVVITKPDNQKIGFGLSPADYDRLVNSLPSEFMFIGFQRSQDGYTFDTFMLKS